MKPEFNCEYDNTKCIAIIKKDATLRQCSRNHKIEGFCLSHHKNKLKLQYGYIKTEKINNSEENEKKENEEKYIQELKNKETSTGIDIRNLNFKKVDKIQFKDSDKKYLVNWVTGEVEENKFSSLISK